MSAQREPGSLWFRYEIEDLRTAFMLEVLAFCQWGTDYKVEGVLPSYAMKDLNWPGKPPWPENIFEHQARDFNRWSEVPQIPEEVVEKVQHEIEKRIWAEASEVPEAEGLEPVKPITGKAVSLFDDD
jgi:hypothetical protein